MTKPKQRAHEHENAAHANKKQKAEENESTHRTYNLRNTTQHHPPDKSPKNKPKEKEHPEIPPDNSKLLKLLWNTSTADIKMDTEVFSVERTSTLIECFQGLAKNQYYSCPVLTKKHQFFNFVDVMDITRFTVDQFDNGKGRENLEDPRNFWELIQKHKEFSKRTVKDLTKWPNTRKNWYGLPIPTSYSLLHVAELMAREVNLHRLALVDNLENRNLKGIITQSQLVQFIWENIKLLGQNKLSKQIKDFEDIFHEVYTIHHKATALDAFQLISEKNVTGLPVVDGDGYLIGAVSIKDIKGMAADGSLFWRLYQPLHAYLDILHDEDGMENAPVIYCTKSDKFTSVIDRLIFNKVHRVPVVESESDKKVIGIITLRDVLRMALFD